MKTIRVLIAPLDWGLGHATRCIPIIRRLGELGSSVTIGAYGNGAVLLRREFPHLEHLHLPGWRVRYPERGGFLLHFLVLFPWLLLGLVREHLLLRRLCRNRDFDLILSDNRYGVRHPRIPSVLITHQLRIAAPDLPLGLQMPVELLLKTLVMLATKGLHSVWVPDHPQPPGLAGRLSHPDMSAAQAGRIRYLGPLSRFTGKVAGEAGSPRLAAWPARIDILALVSGPEPHRSRFCEVLEAQMAALPGSRLLLRGKPRKDSHQAMAFQVDGFLALDHLDGPDLEEALRRADWIVARSGYTTLLELESLGKKRVLLVPTPGQPEQEYLGVLMAREKKAVVQSQDKLQLDRDLGPMQELEGFRSPEGAETLLEAAIQDLVRGNTQKRSGEPDAGQEGAGNAPDNYGH